MEIQKAKPSDAAEISKMYTELIAFELSLYSGAEKKMAEDFEGYKTPGQITKYLRSRKMKLIVARENGKLAGFLNGQIEKIETEAKQTAGKFDIFVRGKYRRQGIGHALIEEFSKWLKEKKCDYIYLYAFNANDRATKFYEKQKFMHMSNFYVKRLD